MFRTNLIGLVCSLAFLNLPPCSCADATPCEYIETPLATDDVTLWDTTVAEDIAGLEVPQYGTWRWYSSTDELDIDQADMAFPAVATFVHDPATMRLQEHISGGYGVSCDAPTVKVDGILTFTDVQNETIVSVPITAERMYTAMLEYGASPLYSPIDEFVSGLHEKVEYDTNQIDGSILWVDEKRLVAEFYYHGQSMLTENTGEGVFSLIADFYADENP